MDALDATRPHAWPFIAWAAAGAGIVIAMLTPFTIGAFVFLPSAAVAIGLIACHGSRNETASGLLSGVGVVAVYVGYLNRRGPGDVCNAAATHCVTEWSPWPWLLCGTLLLGAGVGCFRWLRRSAP